MKTAVKLSAYGTALALVFGASWTVGTLTSPGGGADSAPHGGHRADMPAAEPDDTPRPAADGAAPHATEPNGRPAARRAANSAQPESTSSSAPTTRPAAPAARRPTSPQKSAGAAGPVAEDSRPRLDRSRDRKPGNGRGASRHAAKRAEHTSHHALHDQRPKRRSQR